MSEVKINLPVWDAEGRAAATADRRAETTAISKGVAILKAKAKVMAAAKDAPSEAEPVTLQGAMSCRITSRNGQRVREDTLHDLPD